MNELAQDFQDDLEMYPEHSAEILLRDENGNHATDFVLTPDEVRVMFTALRDYHASLGG